LRRKKPRRYIQVDSGYSICLFIQKEEKYQKREMAINYILYVIRKKGRELGGEEADTRGRMTDDPGEMAPSSRFHPDEIGYAPVE